MLTFPDTAVVLLSDRRRRSRVKLVCPLNGRIPLLDLPVTMIECSDSGGFSIQSTRDLLVGSIHLLSFPTGVHTHVNMARRVVHSLRGGSVTQPLFLTGFAAQG